MFVTISGLSTVAPTGLHGKDRENGRNREGKSPAGRSGLVTTTVTAPATRMTRDGRDQGRVAHQAAPGRHRSGGPAPGSLAAWQGQHGAATRRTAAHFRSPTRPYQEARTDPRNGMVSHRHRSRATAQKYDAGICYAFSLLTRSVSGTTTIPADCARRQAGCCSRAAATATSVPARPTEQNRVTSPGAGRARPAGQAGGERAHPLPVLRGGQEERMQDRSQPGPASR